MKTPGRREVCERREIREAVKNHRDEIVEWTKKLIRFASENRPPGGTEGEAQAWVHEECSRLGLLVDAFRPDSVPGILDHEHWLPGRVYDPERKNVVAVWPGRGQGKSLLLSGHVDVAPFEPDDWKITRPFTPRVVDGRLYGRGAADMKGGIAASFWALKILRELSFEPGGDLIFETVVDEEFAGGNGTLAARVKNYNADCAIYTEPSGMEVCPAGLGAFLGDLTLRGNAGMPFTGHEVPNPVFGLARVIELFNEWLSNWRRENSHPLFDGPGKQLNIVLWNMQSSAAGETVQMGTPLTAGVSWIIWCYPGMTFERFREGFDAFWTHHLGTDPVLKHFTCELQPTYHLIPPWETDASHPAIAGLVQSFTECMGKTPAVAGAPFSSDLAVYGKYGHMPAIILGPRGDNLHGPDEWVLVEDILSLTEILACFAAGFCG